MQSLQPLRPIFIGILGFMALNLILTAVVTFSPLNRKFNFSYGNFLPAKLEQLKASSPKQLDILFLGTSQTNNGFATPVFEAEAPVEINSFNMGLPSNRYDIMLGYLKYHTRHYGKPRVLLVELGPSIQEKKESQYYLPALYYRSIVERDPGMAASIWGNPLLSWNVKKEMLLSSFSSLHQFRLTFSPVNILGKITARISEKLKGTSTMLAAQAYTPPTSEEDSAYLIREDQPQKGWYPKEMEEPMRTPEGLKQSLVEAKAYFIDTQEEVSFEKLEALLAYCDRESIPVVLITWPNHPGYLKLFEGSRLAGAYRRELATLLREHPVPVIDLNQRMLASSLRIDGLFSDPRHLTPEGAKLFTTELSRKVFDIPEISQRFKTPNKTVLTYQPQND